MSTARDEVINAAGCPACGAAAGEPCLGVERRGGRRRRRKGAHAERWIAADMTPRPPTERKRRTRRRLAPLEPLEERRERERRDLEAIARLAEPAATAARHGPSALGASR
jgi:hypothetical protein